MPEIWDMAQVSNDLPSANDGPSKSTENSSNNTTINPQEHGWACKTPYDYETYSKTNKEIAEITKEGVTNDEVKAHYPDAVGGIPVGDWHCNAEVYTWDDEYGDVGPEFPELERQLFGSEFHVKSGIDFLALSSIKVVQEGVVRIKPCFSFQNAGLHPVMLRNVELAGYQVPTPIQQYCLPAVHMGYDVVACAQTGSGKTAAFLIPILSKLMGKAKKLCAPRPNPAKFQEGVTQAVRAEPLVCIVAPSRELATQIFDEARRFCYRTMLRPCVIYGGGPTSVQIAQLQKGCDVLIGTPGRLVDFINRPHILTLRRLKYMVIDEADEMIGASWEEEMKTIMTGGDQEEGNINYLMFSATFPKQARQLAREHLAMNHLRIRVGRAGSTHENIKQEIINVAPSMKRKALQEYLLSMPPARTIIFVNSKRSADELDDFLYNSAFPCTSIHADRTQREREDSLRAFRTGKAPILIATGVSARGLDIFNVMAVINFDLPSFQYGGIEEYCHRIGRTGRIGNTGIAMSFFTSRDEDLAPALVKFLLETHQAIPEFLSHHIPEGFDASGNGDTDLLDFEDESDVEEEKENTNKSDNGSGIEINAHSSHEEITDVWNAGSGKGQEFQTKKSPSIHGQTSQGKISTQQPGQISTQIDPLSPRQDNSRKSYQSHGGRQNQSRSSIDSITKTNIRQQSVNSSENVFSPKSCDLSRTSNRKASDQLPAKNSNQEWDSAPKFSDPSVRSWVEDQNDQIRW